MAAERLSEATGAEILPLPADVSVPTDATLVTQQATRAFGALDILLANAGGPPPGPFLSHDHATWVRALETNLLSTASLFRAALPGMVERRWGRLLVITSLSALEPIPGLILSSAARAGILGLVKGLSDEVAPHGVTVNALCPGSFRTGRIERIWEERAKSSGVGVEGEEAKTVRAIPIGRLGEPAEVGALAAFLAGDQAGFITGQAVRVDGGAGRGEGECHLGRAYIPPSLTTPE